MIHYQGIKSQKFLILKSSFHQSGVCASSPSHLGLSLMVIIWGGKGEGQLRKMQDMGDQVDVIGGCVGEIKEGFNFHLRDKPLGGEFLHLIPCSFIVVQCGLERDEEEFGFPFSGKLRREDSSLGGHIWEDSSLARKYGRR